MCIIIVFQSTPRIESSDLFLLFRLEQPTSGSGLGIRGTVRELKPGLMEPSMKVYGNRIRLVAMANSGMLMEIFVTSSI